jgi:hypothetical protein
MMVQFFLLLVKKIRSFFSRSVTFKNAILVNNISQQYVKHFGVMYIILHDTLCNIGANHFLPYPWRHHHGRSDVVGNESTGGGWPIPAAMGMAGARRGNVQGTRS